MVELFDDCGGSFDSTTPVIEGTGGKAEFAWTPPVRPATICVLTANVTAREAAGEFTVVIRVDDPTASEAFDLGALRVAEYRLGKRAAASYTFDDGCASSFQIADIFERVAALRATFFIIAGFVLDENWPRWRGLAERGHEIGNHSLSHLDLANPDLTEEQLTTQIEGAQQRIEQNIGERPMTFAFPGNSASPLSAAIALRSHVATRNPGLPFGGSTFRVFQLNSRTTIDGLNAGLEDALAARAWFVAAGHGIDGNGWEPLSSDVLVAHLTTAATLSEDLWVDTFVNVARYRLAREMVQPVIIAVSQQTLRVRLEGALQASLAVPLTLEIPVIKWPAAVRAHDASGAEVPIIVTPNALLVEVLPLEEIELEVLPSGT